jgi:hypothetical protein
MIRMDVTRNVTLAKSCFARPVPRTSPWSDRRHPQRHPSWSTGWRPHAGLGRQGQPCSPPSRKVIFGSGGSLRHTQVVGRLLGQTLGRTSRTAVVTPPLRSTLVKVTSTTSTPDVPALLVGWRRPSFWRVVRRPVGCAQSPVRGRSTAPTASAAERGSVSSGARPGGVRACLSCMPPNQASRGQVYGP